MQIRLMELEDIEQVVILENQTWDTFSTPASLPIINKDEIIKDFKDGTYYLAAEESQGILGILDYHTYHPFPSDHYVVTFGTAVPERTRGRDIEHELIQTFSNMAKADDYQKVLIRAPSSNERACASYERLGFKQKATLKNQFYLSHTYVDGLAYSYYLEEIHAK